MHSLATVRPSHEALKCIKITDSRVIWSPKLSSLKINSRRALQNWRNNGYPTSGVLFDNKQSTKCLHKNALKEHKLSCNHARLMRMRNCIDSANINSFWKLWKKHERNAEQSSCVLLPSDFVNGYKGNFIKSSDNGAMFINFINQFSCNSVVNCNDILSLSVEDIEKTCHSLSISNCLDYNDLTIRHCHYAHPSVFIWLKELYNSMLVHGFVPESFGNNVIIPIVKNKSANCNDSTNYRPISIEPICTKLFEQCLILVFEPFLCFHSNQFGFVPGGGCNKALFAFRTTVEYFQNNNSRVYVASLDLSKALDRENHYGLLTLLIKRGMHFF